MEGIIKTVGKEENNAEDSRGVTAYRPQEGGKGSRERTPDNK